MVAGASYRRAAWLPVEEVRAARAQLLRNFLCRPPDTGDGTDPEWLRTERVLAQRARAGGQQFLVKARTRTHAASSWLVTRARERERLLIYQDSLRALVKTCIHVLLDEDQVSPKVS